VHFRNFAPEPKEYAVNRYTFEAQRHWGILDERLGKQKYMCGSDYSIVDMAVWGWSRLVPFVLGPDAAKQYPNLQRHLGEINARPAAVRALALKEKHSFKADMDDAAKLAMFPHLGKKVA
jgi:GST-like protein